MTAQTRFVERIRHDLKFRVATVKSAERITPKMVRILVESPDLVGFSSLAYDDHVKLFFAAPGETISAPVPGPNGLIFPDGKRPEGRDYTPRAFDAATGELTLDFVLHGDGPASSWAENAKPGDTLGVGGPRGSFVVRGDYDWYLLAGDETALPAIGRRLEELPKSATAIAVIEIADNAERQTIDGPSNTTIHWAPRNGAPLGNPNLILDIVKSLTPPEGDGYVFAAGESAMSKAVRAHFVDGLGHDPDWIKAAGYWQSGSADFYDGHAH